MFESKNYDSRRTLRLETKWTIFVLALSGVSSLVILIVAASTAVKMLATGTLVLQLGAGVMLLLWHPSRVRMDEQRIQWRDATSQRLYSLRFSEVRDVVWQDTFNVCVVTERGERLIPLGGLDGRGREALMARLNERQLQVNVG